MLWRFLFFDVCFASIFNSCNFSFQSISAIIFNSLWKHPWITQRPEFIQNKRVHAIISQCESKENMSIDSYSIEGMIEFLSSSCRLAIFLIFGRKEEKTWYYVSLLENFDILWCFFALNYCGPNTWEIWVPEENDRRVWLNIIRISDIVLIQDCNFSFQASRRIYWAINK